MWVEKWRWNDDDDDDDDVKLWNERWIESGKGLKRGSKGKAKIFEEESVTDKERWAKEKKKRILWKGVWLNIGLLSLREKSFLEICSDFTASRKCVRVITSQIPFYDNYTYTKNTYVRLYFYYLISFLKSK